MSMPGLIGKQQIKYHHHAFRVSPGQKPLSWRASRGSSPTLRLKKPGDGFFIRNVGHPAIYQMVNGTKTVRSTVEPEG